jgi:amino acid transporter
MARVDLFAKIPLIGMSMVFLAMFIVAVTAYLHIGWWSIIGYAIAAVLMVFGFALTFRDINDTSKPPPVVRPSGPTNGAAQ